MSRFTPRNAPSSSWKANPLVCVSSTLTASLSIFPSPSRSPTASSTALLSSPASQIAGLGPFRLKEYVAGQRITLERNPYYWKVDQAGTQLPYLSELVFLFAGSEDNQVLRFQAGESDIINRVGARNFAVLEKDRERRGYQLVNAGASMEYNFLFFNLADL